MKLVVALFQFFVFLLSVPQLGLAQAKRIVSLAPNLTEIVYALGLEGELVGVSEQCDFPPAAKKKQRVGAFSAPNLEQILALKPTHVLATEGNPLSLVTRLEAHKVTVLRFHPKRAVDVASEIEGLSAQLGKSKEGKALGAQIDSLLSALAKLKPPEASFLLVLSLNPVYSAASGTWLADIFEHAQFKNVVAQTKIKYPSLSREFIVSSKPAHVFITNSSLPRTLGESEKLSYVAQQIFGSLKKKVSEHTRIHIIPNDILERPGPRLVQGLDWLIAEVKK